jgi:hypothetical protein
MAATGIVTTPPLENSFALNDAASGIILAAVAAAPPPPARVLRIPGIATRFLEAVSWVLGHRDRHPPPSLRLRGAGLGRSG